ncbi:MAG: right-handed parallel beta-helix repeat-containing protein [Bacteroidales bacterium]|nr:right-handed parallel beta-helix repeat-containing protein [Bacteroidales bacterium]
MSRTIISLLILLLPLQSVQAKGTVFLKDYLDKCENSEADAMPAIRAALDCCARTRAGELVLPRGVINIRPEHAYEHLEAISNNSQSLKRVAFLMKGMKDFRITGDGTTLMFNGFMSPFSLEGCKGIRISGIDIDYARPFVSEGRILSAGKGWMELSFSESFPVEIRDGLAVFLDKDGVEYPYCNLLEFDTRKKEVAYGVHDWWLWNNVLPAKKVGENAYRFEREDFDGMTPGNTMVFGAAQRLHPAFTLWECENFCLEDVNLYNAGGMGVIAQCCRNVTLNRVRVVPTPGSDHIVSISADATHFVNCKGYIRMTDCEFRNQKDDATNIHGWYMAVDSVLCRRSALLRWRNGAQCGIRFLKKGMRLEFADPATLTTYAHLRVRKVEYLNSEYALVKFREHIPARVRPMDVVAEDDSYPDVLISGCYIGNNRARGLLIGSRGKVVIEKNTFHTPGSAILFEGDGRFWYEQSGVRDVLIRDNLFLNCMYGPWGRACISVGTGLADKEASRYHSNIVVEGNVFRGFDNRIVNIYSVDGFSFRNNTIEMTSDYPEKGSASERFVMEHCDNTIIEQ